MKADLRKYRDHTILYNAKETNTGSYTPVTTIFKNGEDAIKLNFENTFDDRDEALSFALGAGEVAVNEKLKNKKPDVSLLTGEFKISAK